MIIDRKYKILAVNPCNGHIHTEEDSFLVTAADLTAMDMLNASIETGREIGCSESHIESLVLLAKRVLEFQNEYGSKIPDTDTPCEIDRCIGGKI